MMETPETVAMEYVVAAEGNMKTALLLAAIQILDLEETMRRLHASASHGFRRLKPREIATLKTAPPSILLAMDDP